MIDFAADNSIFLDDSPHSVAVGGETAPVIYDAPFRREEIYEGQVESSAPGCSMLDSDATRLGVQHATRLSVYKNETTLVGNFEVIGVEPDGLGLTRFTLTKDF